MSINSNTRQARQALQGPTGEEAEHRKPLYIGISQSDKRATVLVEEVDDDGGSDRKPLKLSCTSARCDVSLHCFRKSRKMASQGACAECGRDDLVDWERVRSREIGDARFVFQELEKEMVRHIYWHVPFDQHAINKALRKGKNALYGGIAGRIHLAVGGTRHPAEGQQTKWLGDVYFYAQHATATCCRRCLEYWHGILQGAPLTPAEETYLCDLIKRYLDLRIPDQIPNLSALGIKVPAIRKPNVGLVP